MGVKFFVAIACSLAVLACARPNRQLESQGSSSLQQKPQNHGQWLHQLNDEHPHVKLLISSGERRESDEPIEISTAEKIIHSTDAENAGNGRKVENLVRPRYPANSEHLQSPSDDFNHIARKMSLH